MPEIEATPDGENWRFWRTETVLLNAYTDTPLGTDRATILGGGGYQHTVACRTLMEIRFDRAGVLWGYEITRGPPR